MTFPSNAAAVLVGAVVTPVFVLVYGFAQRKGISQLLVLLWDIIGFFIPFIAATVDREYIRKVGGLFQLRINEQDLTDFFIPTAKRIGIWFASTAAALIVLKIAGIRL